MVEPHSSNFRLITTKFLGVRIFRKFTGIMSTRLLYAMSCLDQPQVSRSPAFMSIMFTPILNSGKSVELFDLYVN